MPKMFRLNSLSYNDNDLVYNNNIDLCTYYA